MDALQLSPTARRALTSEINKTPDVLRGLSLKDITTQYGTSGLYLKLIQAFQRYGLQKNQRMQEALELGLTLHEEDLRTNGNYADHLLRVTLRILETYGIKDPCLIAAAPLHDALEDHAPEIIKVFHGIKVTDSPEARKRAYKILHAQFGEAADLVLEVTKPFLPPGANKIKEYEKKTKSIVARSPKGRVLKLSDFIDNAVGNHYTIGPLKEKLDRKYLNCYIMHARGLFLKNSLITGTLRENLLHKLRLGHQRAAARLGIERAEIQWKL